MNFTHFLIHFLFLEFTLHFICAQDGNDVIVAETDPPEPEEEDEEFNSTMTFVEGDAVSQLNSIQRLDQFLPLLRRGMNGEQVTWDDMFSEYTDSSGKVVIHGGGRMAVPDECSPRESTVRLTMDTTEHNVIHFPRCTKIPRCGGCCASPHLRCRAAYTERVSLKVLKAEIPFPGSNHLIYKGFAPAIVERHVSCRVVCTLTPDLCGPKKRFLRNQCSCECLASVRCNPPRIWDPEECECKCQTPPSCCPNGSTSCGVVLDHNCQCGVDNGRVQISATSNVSNEDVDNYYSSRNLTRPNQENVVAELPQPIVDGSSSNNNNNNNNNDNNNYSSSSSTSSTTTSTTPSTTASAVTTTPTPTTTSSTTTSTTTTARTTRATPTCAGITCPPHHVMTLFNRRCTCRRRRGPRRFGSGRFGSSSRRTRG